MEIRGGFLGHPKIGLVMKRISQAPATPPFLEQLSNKVHMYIYLYTSFTLCAEPRVVIPQFSSWLLEQFRITADTCQQDSGASSRESLAMGAPAF